METLDALLVLGKKNPLNRIISAFEIYYLNSMKNKSLNIIISGKHSGISRNPSIVPEAGKMEDFLMDQKVPKEHIFPEYKAKDTLGNIVYSWNILDKMFPGNETKKIGLVTDKYHMDRALWTANQVLPEKYQTIPCPTNIDKFSFGKETILKNILKYELKRNKLQKGDKEEFDKYMKEKHPMHAENAPIGLYKIIVSLAKIVKY